MHRFGSFKTFLLQLHQLKLLPTIFEELEEVTLEDLATRLLPLDHFPQDVPVIAHVLELFPNTSLAHHLTLCDKFKLSNEDKLFVKYYSSVRTAIQSPARPLLEPYDWAYLYAHPQFSLCLMMTLSHFNNEKKAELLAFHTQAQKNLEPSIRRIKTKDPVVKSQDLLKAGIAPGVLMGKLLKEAEKLSINHNLYDPKAIISRLKAGPLWP